MSETDNATGDGEGVKAELAVMQTCLTELMSLPSDARGRALAWLHARITYESSRYATEKRARGVTDADRTNPPENQPLSHSDVHGPYAWGGA